MSTSVHQSSLPDNLRSSEAKLVYLSLTIVGEATVRELQQMLGLPKLTLLPILESLVAKNLARRTEGKYGTR